MALPDDQKRVFSSSFEALHRAAGQALTPSLRTHLKQLGLDYDQPLQSEYPFAVWSQSMNAVALALFPGESEAQRHYHLGRRMMDSYGDTIVGRMLIAMTRAIGPARTLGRAARNLRTSNNYVELEVLQEGPRQYRLRFQEVRFPDFYRGLVERGLETSGATQVKVALVAHEGSAVDLTCSWS
jgi:uncharacterized protein (TIGR02265 family)